MIGFTTLLHERVRRLATIAHWKGVEKREKSKRQEWPYQTLQENLNVCLVFLRPPVPSGR